MNLVHSDEIKLKGIEEGDKMLPEMLSHSLNHAKYLNSFSNVFSDIASTSSRCRMFGGSGNSYFDQAMDCCWASYLESIS